jgi:hypothetical protein
MEPRMPAVVGRSILVCVAITAAETVHGIARSIWLIPLVGDRPSRQIGIFTASLIILGIAWATVPWIGATTRRALLMVGGIWVALMLAFEMGLGRALGVSWERLLSDYDLSRGGLMPLGLIVLLLAPLWVSRWRAKS